MKRILTFALALILALSFGLNAMATGYTGTVNPGSVLLTDAISGDILYAKGETQQAYSAGLVKLMTAYVTILNVDDLDAVVTVSSSAFSSLDEDLDITLTPRLADGEEITVRDLLGGMLVSSGNDAALALAHYVGGSVSGFVDMMNSTAGTLGMTGTAYTNPTGKHSSGQYTTAADISILVSKLLEYPELMDILSSVSYTIPANNKASQRVLYNTNRLICQYSGEAETRYENATGMIAGYTRASGGCLAATAEKDGRTLICIILGDTSEGRTERWRLAASLFDFGFEQEISDTPVEEPADDEEPAPPDMEAPEDTPENTPEADISPAPEDTEVPEAEQEENKEKSPLPLAFILSAAVAALGVIAAFLSAKAKAKGHHASQKDSFKVKFRQNFMTWLLLAVIAAILIVVIFIILV